MADAADLQVTLLVAGCSRPAEGTAEAAPPPSAPGLATVISRGDRVASSAGGVEAHLLALFGVNAMREEGVPVAPITRAYDAGEPAAGWWLRADPVEAQADQHTVRLLGNRHLRLAPHEARALAAELNGLLAEDGLVLQPLDPLRWYLGLAVDPGFCGLSVDASVGRDLYACLPSGTQAQRWRRLLTELQMLLSVSPVNQARVARGEPPVTSLWLWGGGALPRVPGGGWTGVASDEPLSCGLAQLAGVVRGARPADAAAWLATSPLRVTPHRARRDSRAD